MKWHLLRTKKVFEDFKRIDVFTYRFPNGKTQDLHIAVSSPAVCTLAVTPDNKFITAKQFRPGPGAILNEIPGGYMKESEEPEAAARRELLEETGYTGDFHFLTMCYDDAYSTMKRYAFVATNCRKIEEQHLDNGEFVDVQLLELPELLRIVRSGEMTDVEVAFLGLDYLGLL